MFHSTAIFIAMVHHALNCHILNPLLVQILKEHYEVLSLFTGNTEKNYLLKTGASDRQQEVCALSRSAHRQGSRNLANPRTPNQLLSGGISPCDFQSFSF